jgi:hypothetical protein
VPTGNGRSDGEHCGGAHIRDGHGPPLSEIGHHRHHLRHGGDEDQPDGNVHEHGAKSADQRHVTRTDRERTACVPRGRMGTTRE